MRMSSGLQIPLVLELKLWSLAERYTLLAPALSSCSSLTLNSWDGRWLGYTGCAYGRLRERRVCPFQNRECTWLVDCTGADICMLPGRQILPVENQLLLSILCSAPYILLGWLTLGRFATLPGCLQADLCSVLVLGIKYWQFFFLSNLSLGFSLFQLLNFKKKSVWEGATLMASQTIVLSLNVKSLALLSVSLEFCTFGPFSSSFSLMQMHVLSVLFVLCLIHNSGTD